MLEIGKRRVKNIQVNIDGRVKKPTRPLRSGVDQ